LPILSKPKPLGNTLLGGSRPRAVWVPVLARYRSRVSRAPRSQSQSYKMCDFRCVIPLAVCITVATGTKFIPRIELPEPQAGPAVFPVYEPITPAWLPIYAARGVLGIVAAMLANLEPGSRSRHRWRCDPTAPLMTVVSFVETLSADGRRRLQSWAATWECPAGEALRAAMTAVEGLV
jgi:hypothetical protein